MLHNYVIHKLHKCQRDRTGDRDSLGEKTMNSGLPFEETAPKFPCSRNLLVLVYIFYDLPGPLSILQFSIKISCPVEKFIGALLVLPHFKPALDV